MNRQIDQKPGLLVLLLTLGTFGIINTEMGVVGIIPQIAEAFSVTVPQAGWTVSVFALIIAISAPVMPMLFSGVDRRTMMLLALGLFTISNLISMVTDSFAVLLVARALPAFLHPVYVSMAFTIAAQSVGNEDAPKAVSTVLVGVSAGMALGLLAGFVNIVGQYMISNAAREAPDFANGLFLTAANFGTMAGTAFCGMFITFSGPRYSLLGTLLCLATSLLFVTSRCRIAHRQKNSETF